MGISIEFATPEIYYSLACFTYVLAGAFCAVVRWCHMCRPYDQQGDIFYPARRQVTFFCAMVTMLLPYVFCPSDDEVWFFVRTFGVIYYPTCFTTWFQRYFRLDHMNRNWFSRLYFAVPLLMLVALLLQVLFFRDTFSSKHLWIGECVAGALSLLISLRFVKEGWWLNKKIDEYHAQNYSNESDFPYLFAKKVLFQPVAWTVVMWLVFLTGSREVKAVVDILCALWMVRFLCVILHPNRNLPSDEMKEEIEQIEQESKTESASASACDWETVRREVLEIVSRRYLEPSLKRVEVIRDVKLSTQAQAGKFITEVGFYKLVNAFRIRHFEKLQAEAPDYMSQEMIAEKCGFKNRWALSNARKRMVDFDYSLIEAYV